MKREQNRGTTDIATRYEAASASTTPRASAVKRYLLTPERKTTGKNTIAVVMVAARTASATSRRPSSAAVWASSPEFEVAKDVFQHDHGVIDQP